MSGERIVEAAQIASISDVAKGDLVRWRNDDGTICLGRVLSVNLAEDGFGVDLTFGT